MSKWDAGAIAEDDWSEGKPTDPTCGRLATQSTASKPAAGTEPQSWASKVREAARAQAAARTIGGAPTECPFCPN